MDKLSLFAVVFVSIYVWYLLGGFYLKAMDISWRNEPLTLKQEIVVFLVVGPIGVLNAVVKQIFKN